MAWLEQSLFQETRYELSKLFDALERCEHHKPQIFAELRSETGKLLARQKFCNVVLMTIAEL